MFTIRSAGPAGVRFHGAAIARHALRLLQAAALCASFAGGATDAVAADRLTVADRRSIEQTIRRQLDAFGRDDAERAFAFATPDIRRLFGSPDNFLQMVKDHYGPVYRPGSVVFVSLDPVGGQWVQVVQIADGDGRVWRALFTMQRQTDKSWKVGGCQLVQTSAIAI